MHLPGVMQAQKKMAAWNIIFLTKAAHHQTILLDFVMMIKFYYKKMCQKKNYTKKDSKLFFYRIQA